MHDPAAKPRPLSPTDVLIDLVLSFLGPMFLAASNGDIHLARIAALQTMNAYGIRHQADLLAAAPLVAFSLAILGSLGLSMNDGLSPSMVLRLRGNANACNRSAEQLRHALRESHETAEPAAPEPDDRPAPPPAVPRDRQPAQPSAQAQPHPAAPATPDEQRRAMWAAAFTEVAAEYAAEMPHLPPAEQHAASIRAAALNSSASALLSGVDLSHFAPDRLPKPPTGV